MSINETGPQAAGFSELAEMASGFAQARTLQTAVKLRLFESLKDAELDELSLARKLGAAPRATGLLANALAALGLLSKNAGRFSLTGVSRRFLLESSDEYLGGMLLFQEALWDVWGRLEESVRSGQPARRPDMFQATPAETARFIGAMDSLARARGDARYLAQSLDLSGVGQIGDVGGGPGTYMAAFLRRWPKLRAAIYDLPATLEVARRLLAAREPELSGRISLAAVDYLKDEIPGPNDALLLSNVIHIETEETNAELMKKCFRALAPGGRLFVKDHIMSADLTEPRDGALFSLHMLLLTRGRDYSFDELSRWLQRAGFQGIEEHRLPSPPFSSSLVIAQKP